MRATSPSLSINWRLAHMERLSVVVGVIIMLCGASVLYGWAMDIEFLKRVETGLASMNPMTASAFILAGLTLALQYRAAGSGDMEIPLARRLTVKICAVILLIFGVLVVSNYFLGRGFAVDQILFSGKLTDELTGIRSQTAPSTALCLIFASLALLFLDVTPEVPHVPAQRTLHFLDPGIHALHQFGQEGTEHLLEFLLRQASRARLVLHVQ